MIERNHFIFIAQHLHTIVKAYNESNSLLDEIDSSLYEGTVPALPEPIRASLMGLASKKGPVLILVNGNQSYTVFHTPDKILLIGPCRVFHDLTYYHTKFFEDMDYFRDQPLYECSLPEYIRVILPSYNLYYEDMLSEEDIYQMNFHNPAKINVQEKYSELVFQNREESAAHNPYSQEFRMLSSIENGDLALLEECRREEVKQHFGVLSPDSERNFRNLGICVITLISRAAIRGGVNAELAFSLCDSYIMEIEQMKNLYELGPLVEGAKTNFCTMVKEQKEHRQWSGQEKSVHPLVEKTKDYIFSCLHGRITLQDAADNIHVNPNYLSSLFSKYEGVPFSAFVTAEKMKLVKNLLIYSDYSYIEIANYLGFASQSYLGKQFKEYSGMTLRQYRNLYSSNEFKPS